MSTLVPFEEKSQLQYLFLWYYLFCPPLFLSLILSSIKKLCSVPPPTEEILMLELPLSQCPQHGARQSDCPLLPLLGIPLFFLFALGGFAGPVSSRLFSLLADSAWGNISKRICCTVDIPEERQAHHFLCQKMLWRASRIVLSIKDLDTQAKGGRSMYFKHAASHAQCVYICYKNESLHYENHQEASVRYFLPFYLSLFFREKRS